MIKKVLLVLMMVMVMAGSAAAYEYRSPAWMDNDTIICVKYMSTVKKRLFRWLGDISDSNSIVTKQQIQIVSMDIDGQNEKVIKDIVIDYPGMSPKWQEEVFKGVRRIYKITYNPQRKLIAFGTHEGIIFVIDLNGNVVKTIKESGLPRWSPDGNKLLYCQDGPSVWIWDIDEERRYRLIDNAIHGVWSPDGKRIAFSRQVENERTDIFVYDMETKQESEMEGLNKASISSLGDWSPDGTMIATDSGGVYSLDGKYLKEPGATTPRSAKWSFDGNHFVGECSSDKGYITIVDKDGKNVRVLR